MLRGRLGVRERCCAAIAAMVALCACASPLAAQAPGSGFGPPIAPVVPPTSQSPGVPSGPVAPPQLPPQGAPPLTAPPQALPPAGYVPPTTPAAPQFPPAGPSASAAGPRLPTAVPTPGEIVVDVRVVGNDAIKMNKIRPHVRTFAERPFDPDLIQEDVRSLNKSRMFVDVQALYDRTPQGGLVVIFKVVERPVLKHVTFQGNTIRDKTLLKKSELTVGSPLDPFAIEEARRRIEQFYHDKGYQKVTVTLKEGTQPGDKGATFEIVEGPKQRIQAVEFVGNSIATDGRIKAATHLESKPPILWVWKGYYNEDNIDGDIERITDYYRSLGYFRAKVSREIKFNEDDDWAKLSFVIDEGPRYRIRDVKFIGNEKLTTELLSSDLKVKTGDYFDRTNLNVDLSKIQDDYGGRGYIFADVQADPRFQEEPGVLDLVYTIQEGKIWRVGKINVHIEGENPHTRIATALNRIDLRPGDIVDIRKVRASERRLQASGLFLADRAKGEMPRITFSPPDESQLEQGVAGRPPGAQPPKGGNFRGQSPDPVGVINLDLNGTWYDATPSTAKTAQPAAAPAPAPRPRVPLPGPNDRQASAPMQPAPRAQTVRRPEFNDEAPEAQPAGTYAVERFLGWLKVIQPPTVRPAPTREEIRAARFQSPYAGRTMPVAQAPPAPNLSDPNVYGTPNYGAQSYTPPATQPNYGQLPSQYSTPSTAPVPGQPGALPPRVGSPQNPAPAVGQNFAAPPPYAAGPTTPGAQPMIPGPAAPGGGYSDPSQLYPDGGYDFLGVQPDPTIDIDAYATETQTGRLMFSVGVNSDAGLLGSVILDEQNFDITRFPRSFEDIKNGTAFRGAGQQFRIEAVPGTQVQRYSFNFREPYLFDTAVSFGMSAFLFDRRYTDWDEQRLGGRLSLGYMFSPDLSGSVYMRAEDVNISNIVANAPAQLEETAGDNSLYIGGVNLIHDTRDNTFMPSDGHYIELALEQGFGTYDFPRANAEARQYFLMGQRADGSGRQTLGITGRLGFSGSATPVFEHYFAGGFTTLRGFDFRGASPRENNVIVGGEFMALTSVEYIFPITANDMLRGVVFCDAGTVEPDVRFDSDSFRVAPGFGLRIQIPALGPAPIALDLAVPVAHAPGDDIQNFSFFVGLGR